MAALTELTPALVREFSLTISANAELTAQGERISARLRKRVLADTYDPMQAPQAWMYLIVATCKALSAGAGGQPWHALYPATLRRELAECFARVWENNLRAGAERKLPSGSVR